MELKFAQIDAKDDIYCGYRTVGVYDEKYDPYERGPRSVTNAKVLVQAEEEYLKRLNELQVELREKYKPMLEDDTDKEQRPWEDEVGSFDRKPYYHLYYT